MIWGTYGANACKIIFFLKREGKKTNLERSNEDVVRIKVRDNLKSTTKRNDLPLNMFVQNPKKKTFKNQRSGIHATKNNNFKRSVIHPMSRIPTSW